MFSKKRFIITHFILLFFASYTFAQKANIAIGQWRTHSSFAKVSLLAYDGNKLYTAPTSKDLNISGTIASLDANGELNLLSKENGLSDFGVAKIGYSENTQILVVIYDNGNIDFVKKDGNIINLPEIKSKDITGIKSANHLNFYKDLCIISYDFGMCIIDLKKLEVKETITTLTPVISKNKIYSSAIANNIIYAFSENGIFFADFNSGVNLMDAKSWALLPNTPFSNNTNSKFLSSFNDELYVSLDKDGIYKFQNNSWEKVLNISGEGPLNSVCVSNSKLLICTAYAIFSSTNGKDYEVELNERGDLLNATFDKNNQLWVATPRGLGKKITKFTISILDISSPKSNSCFRAYYNKYIDEMVILAGGYTDSYDQTDNSNGFYVFKNGSWNSFRLINEPPINRNFIDIVDVVYSQKQNKYYFASFGWGVAILDIKDSSYVFYDTKNSTLGNAFNEGAVGGVRVNCVALENDKLWAGAHVVGNNKTPLHILSEKKWTVPEVTDINPAQILIDSNGYKWIRNIQGGISDVTVYNSVTNKTIGLSNNYFSGASGSTQITKVSCIELDQKNQMWVGTDKGIAIITESSNVFNTASNSKAYRPIFEGFPLLYTEQILCIQVDGANRKWVGTNNGAWLLNEDGSEIITRFTTENSPLPSNKVTDIEIMGTTGEVFFCTPLCLVSYRGTATLANKETTGFKIFPSPVPPAYDGQIAISGLPSNECTVKITDEFGTMIYELKSTGGSAIWNGKNYSGTKAKSGMYLVFSSDKDGENNFIGKFAVIE